MFGSQLLDIAIGIVFLYLLLSLICSGVNEILLSALNMRGRDLARGLRELLNDKRGDGMVKALYDHGLIYGLFKGEYRPGHAANLPSYIPARSFALAIMDIIPRVAGVTAMPSTAQTISGAQGSTSSSAPASACAPGSNAPESNPLAPLREATSKLADAKIREPILTMIDAAGADAVKARQNIEDWYNSSMDRISGWYKFRTQWVLFSLGILVAIMFNADTFMAARLLSNDSALRQSLVAAAQERAKQNSAQEVTTDLKRDISSLEQLGLPIGWLPQAADTSSPGGADRGRFLPPFRKNGAWLATWLWLFQIHGLGWLVTAVAVSLGAPFWFDLLNKFIIVRSTIKPHEKSPDEKSKES